MALSLGRALLGIDAPAISSKRGVAVEVREASVAPDCALTRPKRSHCNATHRGCFRASWRRNPRQRALYLAMNSSRVGWTGKRRLPSFLQRLGNRRWLRKCMRSLAHRDGNGGPCTHRSTPSDIQNAANYTTLSYLYSDNKVHLSNTLLVGRHSYESINQSNKARGFFSLLFTIIFAPLICFVLLQRQSKSTHIHIPVLTLSPCLRLWAPFPKYEIYTVFRIFVSRVCMLSDALSVKPKLQLIEDLPAALPAARHAS